jgi:hypothetical protein
MLLVCEMFLKYQADAAYKLFANLNIRHSGYTGSVRFSADRI